MAVSALSVIDLQASSSAHCIAVIGTRPRESSKPLNSNSGLTLLELLWATSANLHLRWRVCHAQSIPSHRHQSVRTEVLRQLLAWSVIVVGILSAAMWVGIAVTAFKWLAGFC